jgi:hypothetical protein
MPKKILRRSGFWRSRLRLRALQTDEPEKVQTLVDTFLAAAEKLRNWKSVGFRDLNRIGSGETFIVIHETPTLVQISEAKEEWDMAMSHWVSRWESLPAEDREQAERLLQQSR